MHCSRCHSVMAQTRNESGVCSEQQWFRCPTCARTALVSRPVSSRERDMARHDHRVRPPA